MVINNLCLVFNKCCDLLLLNVVHCWLKIPQHVVLEELFFSFFFALLKTKKKAANKCDLK